MQAWGPVHHRRNALAVYAAFVLALVGVFAWTLLGTNPDILIGSLIVGINLTALGSASRQLRVGTARGAAETANDG